MLLSYNRLLKLIDEGVIEGASKENVNAASIDITLGDEIFTEGGSNGERVSLAERQALRGTKINFKDRVFWLHPGEFILAHTREKFHLPNNISAEYKLKSSMARIGLEHLTAGWCDAGWHNSVLTLELKNMTKKHTIELKPGDKIGQIVFFEHEPVPVEGSYATKGAYNGDASVSGAKRR